MGTPGTAFLCKMDGPTAAWQAVAPTKATGAPGVVFPPCTLFREGVRQLWQVSLCQTLGLKFHSTAEILST